MEETIVQKNQVEKKKLLPLVQQKDTFKMVIPDNVERKIRFLCRNIWEVEWSGVLFYKVSGSFDDGSLIITCVDIFQMDEGVSTYTEFNMSADVCSYICDHPELAQENVYQACVHSHNVMKSFLSNTDLNTVREEGNDMPHFVSLVVNNAGEYTAVITRKIKKVKTITENYSYPTWGGKESIGKTNYLSEEECVEYYYLDIEKATNDSEDEMYKRLEEIRESKRKANTNKFFNNSRSIPTTSFSPMNYSANIKTPSNKQQTEIPFEDDGYIPYGNIHVDEEIVEDLVRQIVTSSVIIPNTSKIDIKKWAGSMAKLYKDRFGDLKTFEEFAINYIDFLLNNANYDCGSYSANILAYEVTEALRKLPQSNWLDTYISILDEYII